MPWNEHKRGTATHFLIVFTPTLFSSVKKMKICSIGLSRWFVKKLS